MKVIVSEDGKTRIIGERMNGYYPVVLDHLTESDKFFVAIKANYADNQTATIVSVPWKKTGDQYSHVTNYPEYVRAYKIVQGVLSKIDKYLTSTGNEVPLLLKTAVVNETFVVDAEGKEDKEA